MEDWSNLKSNSMLLIKKVTCAVVENAFLHLEGQLEQCPESSQGMGLQATMSIVPKHTPIQFQL